MKFFISVSRRKVSHDLPLDVFILYRAVHLREKKKSMFLRYTLRSCSGLERQCFKEIRPSFTFTCLLLQYDFGHSEIPT